jgi:bis(5'-nucleosyl)-tetraphosphatase (symmetrical)
MALFAIGDVQGCYDDLRRLLDAIRFDSANDTLWFTGDLVNRGSRSLAVVRFVASLGERAHAVLGNHDLHLLAVAAGVRGLSPHDTFQDILAAADRDELLAWLRTRPLLHTDGDGRLILVHAGVLPQWTVASAKACAREVEQLLAGPRWRELLERMYGDEPSLWSDDLQGWDRLRLIVNAFTRLRFCDVEGRANYVYKGALGSQPSFLVPWFAVPGRLTREARIVFGHWSLLGAWNEFGVVGIDTGCVWGQKLTSVSLSAAAPTFISVDCDARKKGCKTTAPAAQ